MTIVYVLICGKDDLYFEQFWVSLVSCRKWNPTAKIILLTSADTMSVLCDAYHQQAMTLLSDIIPLDLSQYSNGLLKSRHIKTSMRALLKGDFLYIDCDTIICGDLSGVQSFAGDVLCVPDFHHPCRIDRRAFSGLCVRADIMGYHTDGDGNHYNSGVMLVRDTPAAHDFFKLWHTLWQETCSRSLFQDQLSLNEANYRMHTIKEMSGIYNCQNVAGIPYLAHSRVIHYFFSQIKEGGGKDFYILGQWSFLKAIKDAGKITPEVQKIIDDPKAPENFFDGKYILADTSIYKTITGGFLDIVWMLQRWSPALFNFLDKIMLKKRARTLKKTLIQGSAKKNKN